MSYCRHRFSRFLPKSQIKPIVQFITINLLESFQIKAFCSKEVYDEKKRWLRQKSTNRITYCGKTQLRYPSKTQLTDKIIYLFLKRVQLTERISGVSP